MAHASGRLGHFLPYLLGRQLRAVFWPAGAGSQATMGLLGLLSVIYGLVLGYLLRHHDNLPADTLPKLLAAINGVLFATALLADFLPSYRAVQRPLPEPLPVSARLNATTAFVLDVVSVRRGLLLLFLLAALVASPEYWRPLGLSLLVWLSATALSFNLRLLLSVGRWQHPLFWLNLLCLGAAALWLSREFEMVTGPLAGWLRALAVAGPLLLWAAALWLVAPWFSARYMAEPAHAPGANGRWLARLSPEWKLYIHKTKPALLMGMAMKIGFLVFCAYMLRSNDNQEVVIRPVFYFALLPIVGFTYINNNLLGYIWTATANELERLGLTRRLLALYLRLAVPIMLVECLIAAVFLLVLFPRFMWHYLLLLPLTAAPALALGLWGSVAKAKPVREAVTFSTMRHNASTLINIITMLTALALYFMPWWWARIALALVVTLTAIVPVRRILRNHGPTRRRLWQALMKA
ncbi:hypothetical protein [Hymenobacter lapidiphilus]|uniref:Uncharacterized protein n=1 Tax=Hymenobacter lapidiphilus TaxID=2608003 RepID=A0A7Y7PSY3_9BACT|nr:hypothetical protein [Hymenobacter lapidiphilus]NVO33460.1 hypothetical protein [Hymenobacter lapidiphilus]